MQQQQQQQQEQEHASTMSVSETHAPVRQFQPQGDTCQIQLQCHNHQIVSVNVAHRNAFTSAHSELEMLRGLLVENARLRQRTNQPSASEPANEKAETDQMREAECESGVEIEEEEEAEEKEQKEQKEQKGGDEIEKESKDSGSELKEEAQLVKVTDKQRANRERRRRRRQWREALGSQPLSISAQCMMQCDAFLLVISLKGNIMDLNTVGERFLGLPISELYDTMIWRFLPPEAANGSRQRREEVVKQTDANGRAVTKKVWVGGSEMISKKGKHAFFAAITSLLSKDGVPFGTFTIAFKTT